MDGSFTIDHYMNHTSGIGNKNLTEFTLCMRQNLNYLRGRMSHSLSYASNINDNTLLVYYVINEDDLSEPIGKIIYFSNHCFINMQSENYDIIYPLFGHITKSLFWFSHLLCQLL